MKKQFPLLLILFCTFALQAQEDEKEEQPQGWTTGGKIQLLFNQSAFNSEWQGGGSSSLAGNFIFDYDFSYLEDDFSWDTKIIANFGLTKTSGDGYTEKTSDRLEVNSIVGKRFDSSQWHYTFFVNFLTQFAPGYDYFVDEETGENLRLETSKFLSPGYLQAGPGIMWKRDKDLFVNIAPVTARLIFVNPSFTSDEEYQDGDYFGIDAGKATRFELGASINGYAKYNVIENVVMEQNLRLYSNYLDKPGNIDIDYLLNVNMSINKYLTTNLIFQAIYDDNAIGAFQIREVFGLGFNLNL